MADAGGKKVEWTHIEGGGRVFEVSMSQVLQGGSQLSSVQKIIDNIPNLAVECLKCAKINRFTDILRGCPNCSSTDYSVGGVPTNLSIICARCGKAVIQAVKCQCSCVNPLNGSTLRQPKASGLCFVATAACGDPFAPEVISLTSFRDEVLLRSQIGRWFVRLYCAVSPPIAAVIARSTSLQRVAMTLVVKPATRVVARFRERETHLRPRGRQC